jgi:hypothetical protein
MSGVSAPAATLEPAAPDRHRSLAVRGPLLALAVLALVTGLYGGLERLDWTSAQGTLAEFHGALLVSGLFGTLVGLERAVALGRGWTYAAPIFSALGTLLLLAGAPIPFGAGAYALSASVLAAGSLLIAIQQPAVFTGTLLFGALAWLAGNLLWSLGWAIPDVAGWWLSFLVLTIAAERLELSRLLAPRRGSEMIFLFAMGVLLAGAQNGLMTGNGAVLFGLGLLLMAGWLLRHDIARLNVRRTAQSRFMATCMLAGYGWLAAAGAALIASSPETSVFGYDVALHAILIGFVISMVFGHALIILPAVARLRIRYSSALYGPLALLHGSAALRVGAGLAGWDFGRLPSGLLTVLALVGFGVVLAVASNRRSRGSDGELAR